MTHHPSADLNDRLLRDRAVRAARGQEPFDLLITGGHVADVAIGVLRRADVGLVGPLIASVHKRGTRADTSLRIDATGKVVAPGLIDTHLHIESSMITPRRYAETVVPQGTTTICWDPHEVGNVLGLDGVRWAIDASRDLPLRVLVLAPSSVPSAPGIERAGAEFDAAQMREMLSWPGILGVAEIMDMRGVIERSARMTGIVEEGLASGKLVCGHARDLAGADLQAFAAAGIESDHEIESGEDLLAKLQAGFTVELRGSHDHILPAAVETLLSLPRVPQTLTICTDDVFPDDLVEVGGMIDVLRRLVRYGLPPLEAVRAATLNAAQRIERRDLGLVAPGRRADIVIFDDFDTLAVGDVLASGIHVAANGRMVVDIRPDGRAAPTDTVHLDRLTPQDFQLRIQGDVSGKARFRTVHTPRFTEWREAELTIENGIAGLPDDGLLMAVIHRHGKAPPAPGLGLLQNWGHWKGAIATTVSHDSHNLVVYGRDREAMTLAANRLIETGGGVAVALDGQVTASMALPVCGLLSERPAPEVADELRLVRQATERAADWQPPRRAFKSIFGASLACNPGPHVTDMGVTDGSTGETFGNGWIQPG
jgi:adenine deaminase